MKYLIALLISTSAFAQESQIKIEKVNSVQFEGNEATITFERSNQVYRLASNNKVMPCLENAWKSEQEVALRFKKVKNKDIIEGCRLYNGGIPIFKD